VQENEIRDLQPHMKIMDNKTGEELYYLSFPIESKYVICDNGKNTLWLDPNRIEVIK
jgi:hypothetical protein